MFGWKYLPPALGEYNHYVFVFLKRKTNTFLECNPDLHFDLIVSLACGTIIHFILMAVCEFDIAVFCF